MSTGNLSAIAELLEKKRLLLLDMEQFSAVAVDKNDIATALDGRAKVIAEIDLLDTETERLIATCEKEHKDIRKALKNSCNRGDLAQALLPIFDAAQLNFSILNRIKTLSDEMTKKMDKGFVAVKNNIKLNNQKTKITKYFSNEKVKIFRERG